VLVSARRIEGLNELDLRLTQPDLGRVDVRLSIPEKGRLEAVVATDNQAALDLLRRDGAELAKALAAASPSSDGASLSFQSRSPDEQTGRRNPARQRAASAEPADETIAEWRPMATSGRIERIA
jgi:flagellar hook-length control protein FliK